MPCQEWDPPGCSRRRLLGWSLAAGCGLLTGRSRAAAAVTPVTPPARQLAFHCLHTGASVSTVYWEGGRYRADGLADIDHILRDFRTGDVHPIDPYLLDLVHGLQLTMAYDGPVHVISGYRSPKTNAMLAQRSGKVAKNSYHVKGMAIDLRLPGERLEDVRDMAMRLGGGGVGFYPDSQFVHMDTGPVRAW